MHFVYGLVLLQQDTLAAQGGADTLAGAMEQAQEGMSLFEMLMQGGILMIPLFLLSLIALYVIIERWMFLNNSMVEEEQFLDTIGRMLKDGRQEEAIAYCEEVNKPLPRILMSGIKRLGRSISEIEDAIHNAGKKEIFHLEKRMNWLATIAGVGPLIGFTGTVTGMIQAFRDIQSLQGNVNPSVLAGGIWEALITTATGLIVGILAYGFYNLLLGKVNRMIHELENASADFLDLLQSPKKKRKQQQSA